ncbi:MAG: hypothetical protein COW65_16165 [Cytophagales bacterium CG18_big_fil_WC_8_21_14_2_50_42_9]|nr:MAG: hypothetical protein COW65_16165 [Cytophagales bacterium CG18_big_fil_WC_8_21_14_2_50_42_9]
MQQRNLFNQIKEFYSELRARFLIYKDKHPDRVIGAMFLILLLSVAILLISKASHKETYGSSIKSIRGQINQPNAIPQDKTITSEMMDLLRVYGKASSINPDSLTAQDSLMLNEIDKDINKILDEKD